MAPKATIAYEKGGGGGATMGSRTLCRHFFSIIGNHFDIEHNRQKVIIIGKSFGMTSFSERNLNARLNICRPATERVRGPCCGLTYVGI